MSIKKAKAIGKFINPETGRRIVVYMGTDSKTRRPVRYVDRNDGIKRITPQEFRHWKPAKRTF